MEPGCKDVEDKCKWNLEANGHIWPLVSGKTPVGLAWPAEAALYSKWAGVSEHSA